MSTTSFARQHRRILTEEDEVKLGEELRRRMGEIDRGEVELLDGDEVLRDIFGDEISPSVPR